ncbi:MAG: DUF1569 domain-containing protein [Flavobacteriaceae bacterium]|nr:DUF1569 domain-containing protein [Flavobacteriaceae bacterium]
MKSIFDTQHHGEIMTRLEQLQPDSPRQWGKMTAAQMVWHCQFPLKLAIKNEPHKVKGNPLVRWLFKKSMYNDKPWRKNLPTAPGLVAKEEKDFKVELPKLKALIDECHGVKNREEWNPHPLFGTFTREQWGQMQYKHLDHHLRQFGL